LTEKSIPLILVAAIVTGLIMVGISALFGYAGANASTSPDNKTITSTTLLTPNQVAAGGPIPPNYTLAQQEAKCVASEENAPWYKRLNAFENYNSNRIHYWSCSHFTGSFTNPNQVYAYKSPTYYPTPFTIVTRGVNEMYVYGGVVASNPPPSGPFVAKVEPGSLTELWQTDLLNVNMSHAFTGAGGMYVLGDGDIVVATNTYPFKLNGTTGAVEGVLSLPTGASLPSDSYFNGLNGWPDGTLVMKNLARANGCTLQSLPAMNKCPGPPSVVSVVDSKKLKVMDSLQLSQIIGGRPTTTVYNGKDYLYLVGSTQVSRYEWNGRNLTLDKSWGPVSYVNPGQTGGTAAAIMGNWIVIQTNGAAPSNVALSEVAISQANSSKITRITPIPLEPGQKSYIPNFGVSDLPNNRIYGMDEGPGKVVGINFDQKTGNMSIAWGPEEMKTFGWVNAIGPANHRVLIGTNMKLENESNIQAGPKNPNYTEQVLWLDAATGKRLAASDFFTPMSSGSQVWPGYGGLSYHVLIDGHIMALKVLPKPEFEFDINTNNIYSSWWWLIN